MPGSGIMPHEDGAAYFPTVTTLSLASHTVLDLYRYRQEQSADSESGPEEGAGKSIEAQPFCSIFVPRRSLFIMRQELYQSCL